MQGRTSRYFPDGGGRLIARCFLSLLTLMAIGIMLIVAGSPSVAERIGLDSILFCEKTSVDPYPIYYNCYCYLYVISESTKASFFSLLIVAVLLMVLTLFVGMEIKGPEDG